MNSFQLLDISKDGLAFDSRTGETYTLNHFGWLVLQRVKQGETPEQVADFLCSNFGITQSAAQRDVADFFGQLHLFGINGEQK